ncbi:MULTISPECIES: YcxB family protein [Streptomyces]|uniref:YcxB family protein n=1 Tax=Streptomyces TaxID=1883 RepID=UPI0007890A78|nr:MULTISPECIES: YcxB family protein [unclassified Streptomyces]AVH97583.1 hypothetical protein C5L38_23075 [Streptomyces sp. WAC00288]KYG56181.1 hypothetical protein AWI43_18725 [Streptomyces sp. WAC04657]
MELVYAPDFGELHEAVRARLRATRWWPVMRWAAYGGCAVAVLVAVLALLPPAPEPGAAALLTALGAVAVTCAELIPWATARSLYRLIGAQGEVRAVVGEDGARWTSRDTDTAIRWALLSRYVETPRLFVLFTDRTSGTGFAYLPKRGLADAADADRLRTLLDRGTARA